MKSSSKAYLAIATVMLAGAAAAQTPAIHPTTLSSAAGRYVFGQLNGLARDQFMLDTQTGRLWQMTCLKTDEGSGKCLALTLLPVTYDTDTGSFELPPSPQSLTFNQRKRPEDHPPKK